MVLTCCAGAYKCKGLPTHDAAGEPLSKGQIKKLVKEQTKQKSLYEKHHSN